MRYQDQIILATQRAIDEVFRTARAVPADKLEWKPLDEGRSVLDQLQECAQAPSWFAPMLESRSVPSFGEGNREQIIKRMVEERGQWKTIDECERVCRENSDKLFEAIRRFPDDALGVTIHLPFGGGMDRSMADIMMFHFWNLVYHSGQINYIQTLYGDREMH